jgi:metallo-beta-lactamase family protein
MESHKKIDIHFLGAVGTVTGSKYLLDSGETKVMVDCGLFQGLKELRLKNWDMPPFQPSEIDYVFLTHGHLDHTGYLPRLVKMGFRGDIIGTAPTLEIARIILRDSASIQEEEAERANKEGFSKHHPAEPLYTVEDAEKAIALFKSIPEGEWIEIEPMLRVSFQTNGHIIGSSFIEMEFELKRFVFSGDVGRQEDVLMHPPKKPLRGDIIFVESTYGNRIHPIENTLEKLRQVILHTIEKKGTLIIPSFAVERTQTLMYLLWQLHESGEIPPIPLVMDSPMGAHVLDVFQNYGEWHKMPAKDCYAMCNLFTIVGDYKETWEWINNDQPKVVIAGSGMVTGGRVLTYLRYYLERPETSVLLVGFQAEGTRGRDLLEGAKEIKIYGKFLKVMADVYSIETLSSHADQKELVEWLGDIYPDPEQVFIVHGEPEAARALQTKIQSTYGWQTTIPELYSIIEV